MTTTNYINSGYITKMGDSLTHDGTAGRPVDDIDYPHSGLIKALNIMASTGHTVLDGSIGSGSKNFNMDMDDTTSSTYTTITVRAGTIIREGVLVSVPQQAITEIASGSPSDREFVEQGSAGENFYHVIVVADGTAATIANPSTLETANQIYIRNPSAKDKVVDLEVGDIPIAILRVQNSETPTARHLQYLTTDVQSNSVSVAYDNSDVYTETMSIKGDANRTTFKNKIANADIRFILADNTVDEKFEILTDDDSDGDEGDTTVFSVDGLGTVMIASQDGGATVSPDLVLYRNSSSPANGDEIGSIKFRGKDDGDKDKDYIRLTTEIRDITEHSADGSLIIYGLSNSIEVELMRIGRQDGIVINDDSANYLDFRVETGNETHALFVDAGLDAVGICESSPQAPLHVSGTGTNPLVIIESTDGTSSSSPNLQLVRNSATVAAWDNIGKIDFIGTNSAGSDTTYCTVKGQIDSFTAGSESSRLDFGILVAGSARQMLRIKDSDIVFNDSALDTDIRMESTGNDRMLVLDAGLDRIGIGQALAPETMLDVGGAIRTQGFRPKFVNYSFPPPPASADYPLSLTDDYTLWVDTTPASNPTVTITLPAASATVVGHTFKVIAKAISATTTISIAMTGTDILVDTKQATETTPYALTAGKVYHIVCNASTQWMIWKEN